MEARAYVGCSGWDYPSWRGRVYPRELSHHGWFARYAEEFDTVEINSTFRRLPSEDTVREWARRAPEGFTYAVKMGGFGTHRKKLKDPGQWLPRHLERVDLLGPSLGPNLVQLPPRWRRDVPRLADFLDAAPDRYRWAVELRDRSWLHDDVYELLREHQVALVIHDLIPRHPWVRTADWVYLRFHGPDTKQPYHGRYTVGRLRRAAERIAGVLDEGHEVYAYFNNDVDGAAWEDARYLVGRLRRMRGG